MKLTTVDVAKKLGVTDGTIREMCLCGTLKGRKVPGTHHPKGIWEIDSDDFKDFIKSKAQLQCKQLKECDAGYIAGFIDGEGCLTSFISKQKSDRWWSCRYFIQVLVVEQEPIQWLKEVTGVGYVFQRKRRKEGYQDLWGWRADNHVACAVIRQIMPYLKIKRRQAGIFLEIEDRVMKSRRYRLGGKNDLPMPREEWIERQKLIDEIHRLNKPNGKVLRKEFSVEAT